MRLDKFLKISLIFKTRSSAEKAIDNGNVYLNGKPAKPASLIKVGDKMTIVFPIKKVEYEILEIKEKNVSKKEAKELIRLISEEKIDF
jgi:ribosomal 50S subunit-recycling heat shock protein